MQILGSIWHNLKGLASFKGRETRALFWPYAAFVFAVSIVGMTAIILPQLADSMARMKRFAAQHPEQATVQSGPGSYSISITGHHPQLMPDMGSMMPALGIICAVVIVLLAAAVVRRLHDLGKSGAWGALPIPFIAFASVMMPRVFAGTEPDIGLFLVLFVNNILYLGSLVILVVLLAGPSANGGNRYGPHATT